MNWIFAAETIQERKQFKGGAHDLVKNYRTSPVRRRERQFNNQQCGAIFLDSRSSIGPASRQQA